MFLTRRPQRVCRTAPVLAVRQKGATLIEVMVTALVLAVGLLGLSALQVFAVQSSQQAYHRSQATVIAYEIGDWVRAHRSQILDDVAGGGGQTSVRGFETGTSYWPALVAERLPGGTVALDQWNVGLEQVRITVSWQDDRNIESQQGVHDASEQVQFVTRF